MQFEVLRRDREEESSLLKEEEEAMGIYMEVKSCGGYDRRR